MMRPNPRRNPLAILRSQKGVALMMALAFVILISALVKQISDDTAVEYTVASQQVQRIQAYYAAKAGVELSLLRIMLYKQAMANFGDTLGPNKSMLDPIWSFPFTWPPVVGEEVTGVDQNLIKDTVAESYMTAQYATTIVPEGSKLDINDLGSDIKFLKAATIKQVLQIFQTEIENNDEFRRKHGTVKFDELVNNIADYIDEDKESLNGSDESSPYRDFNEEGLTMPPNRALRTVDELHQVAGMKDEFYQLLAPRITIYGTKGINVNYADKDMLKALHPTITDDVVAKIIERRNDKNLGVFKNEEDFFGFLQSFGVNVKAIQNEGVPLLFDMEFNYRITSTGLAGSSRNSVKREITVVVFDFLNLAQRLAEMKDKQDEQDQGTPNTNPSGATPATGTTSPGTTQPTETAKAKIQAGKGRPSVVYWEEN